MADVPILELLNLTKIYQRSHLGRVQKSVGVEDLSLEIQPGEIFGLLGPNGAGKTTTLKIILGLLFPTSGQIKLLGRNMPDRQAVQNVGFLPEVPYFPKHFTVEEILYFYGHLSGIPNENLKNRIENVLEIVRMSKKRTKRVKECSKGMLQRLSLAQALVHDPPFLILDEPITGLDPMGLNEMRETILRLNREGKTIFFSSHIIAEVEKIAHRVGILVNGKLVRTAKSGDWSQKPGTLEKIFVETVQKHSPDDIF